MPNHPAPGNIVVMPGARVFIGYRREAGGGYAGHLAASLTRLLGADAVFFDERDIATGEAFPERLRTEVQECSVMLAVIGPGWASLAGARGPRLHTEGDWVREELRLALAAGKRVVPVCVGRAELPRRDELPDDIATLAELNAFELRERHWDADVRQLANQLGLLAVPLWRGARRLAALGIAVGLSALGVLLLGTNRSGHPPSDPSRLASYQPSVPQLESLVARFATVPLSVPTLRAFLGRAQARHVPAEQLDAALLGFTGHLHAFVGQRDEQSLLGHNPEGSWPTDAERAALDAAVRAVELGDFDAALAAMPPLVGKSPPDKSNRARWSWTRYKRAQLLAVRGELAQALELQDEVAASARGGGIPFASRLSRARLARELGDIDGASRRYAEAERDTQDQRFAIEAGREHATMLREAGRAAQALDIERRVQATYDAIATPADREAREHARQFVVDLEQSGRKDEAAPIRLRYGL